MGGGFLSRCEGAVRRGWKLDREGLLDGIRSEDFGSGAKAQLGAVEQEGLVEEGGGGIEIVMGRDDEAAFFGEIGEECG